MGNDRLAVVGAAAVQERPRRRRLDELVFEASRAALHEAGVAANEVGFSSISSLDLYDGRSISNGIISPAAAGYLTSEMRIELDSSSALMAAIATIHARQTELALVVAVHAPETTALTPPQLRSFTDKVSSYTFDPHFTRPLGLCATSALALHAAAAIEDGRTSREAMAAAAAAAIGRGAQGSWAGRGAVTAEDILAEDIVAWPLSESMLPAESMGAVAVVLATESRARRTRGPIAWLTGWGAATTRAIIDPLWVHDPFSTTAEASRYALRQAGVTNFGDDVDLVELTAFTPALIDDARQALGVPADYDEDRINLHGGVLSNFPGFANGALRLSQAARWLQAGQGVAGRGRPSRAVVHSMDNLMGPIASSAATIVLEAA